MNADTPSNDEVFEEFQDEPWVRSIFRPVLISILATSAGRGSWPSYGAARPGNWTTCCPSSSWPAWKASTAHCSAVARSGRDRHGIALRFGEIALLLVVLRLASWSFSTGFPRPECDRRMADTPRQLLRRSVYHRGYYGSGGVAARRRHHGRFHGAGHPGRRVCRPRLPRDRGRQQPGTHLSCRLTLGCGRAVRLALGLGWCGSGVLCSRFARAASRWAAQASFRWGSARRDCPSTC